MSVIRIVYCRNCGSINTNGTKFCSGKCRTDWVLRHNIKGGKKKSEKLYDKKLMSYGSSFSNQE